MASLSIKYLLMDEFVIMAIYTHNVLLFNIFVGLSSYQTQTHQLVKSYPKKKQQQQRKQKKYNKTSKWTFSFGWLTVFLVES